MRRTTWLTATLLFSMATTGAAADRPLAKNAALQYWYAFAMLPELNDAERKKFSSADKFATAPLDGTARDLVSRSGLALGFLSRGAELEACDWGQDVRRDGPGTLLPYLSKARRLAGLACLRARVRLADGNQEQAIDDLVDSLALARHCGSDGLLISLLVQGALEKQAIELLGPQVGMLDAATRKQVAERVAGLPAGGSLPRTIESERRGSVDWALDTVAREPKDIWNALGDLPAEQRAAFEKATGGTKEGLEQVIREAGSYYDELARINKLPAAEAGPASEALVAQAERENPFAALLLPSYDKAREQEMKRRERMTSLQTSLGGEAPAGN